METSQRTNRADLKLNTNIVRDLLVRFIMDQTTNAGFTKTDIGTVRKINTTTIQKDSNL